MNQYSAKPGKFQAGGPMAPPPEGAPAPGGAGPGGAPDLEGMLAEYAQTRDPQLAVAICDLLVEFMASQGGPGGPGGPPPGGPPPGGGPGGPPMARKGAKLRRGPVFRK